MSEPLLQVSIDAGYGKQPILEQMQLEIASGETLGLVGSSGAGKSTLILALMGLLSWRQGWTRGTVFFEGRDMLSMKEKEVRCIRGKRIALVPQSPLSALNGSLSLYRHFKEAWHAHEPGFDVLPRIKELFAGVDLPSDEQFLSRKPGQISVGQAQRVVIALAMLHRPSLLIADEPTSALDAGNQINVLNLLRQSTQKNETALLYVSHDLLSVLQLCQRMAVLHAGTIVETLSTSNISMHTCHPVTQSLLRSLPVPVEILQRYRVPGDGNVLEVQTPMHDINALPSTKENWSGECQLLSPRR